MLVTVCPLGLSRARKLGPGAWSATSLHFASALTAFEICLCNLAAVSSRFYHKARNDILWPIMTGLHTLAQAASDQLENLSRPLSGSHAATDDSPAGPANTVRPTSPGGLDEPIALDVAAVVGSDAWTGGSEMNACRNKVARARAESADDRTDSAPKRTERPVKKAKWVGKRDRLVCRRVKMPLKWLTLLAAGAIQSLRHGMPAAEELGLPRMREDPDAPRVPLLGHNRR